MFIDSNASGLMRDGMMNIVGGFISYNHKTKQLFLLVCFSSGKKSRKADTVVQEYLRHL